MIELCAGHKVPTAAVAVGIIVGQDIPEQGYCQGCIDNLNEFHGPNTGFRATSDVTDSVFFDRFEIGELVEYRVDGLPWQLGTVLEIDRSDKSYPWAVSCEIRHDARDHDDDRDEWLAALNAAHPADQAWDWFHANEVRKYRFTIQEWP